MNKQTMVMVAAGFLIFVLLPVEASPPDPDGVCDGDEPANVDCKVLVGDGSLAIRNVAHVGVGFCQDETTNLPFQCQGMDSGDLETVGFAAFGDPTWTGDHTISIWVKSDSGSCTEATGPPCGFYISVCNDRNQNSVCTSGSRDELWEAYTPGGVVGSGCSDDCEPNGVGLTVCMNDSIFGDWSSDQIVVYVGNWAGPTNDFDVGAGLTSGTFTVWMEDEASSTCSQEPPDGDNLEGLVAGALWTQRNIRDVLVGSVDDIAPGLFWAATGFLNGTEETLVQALPDCFDGNDNDGNLDTDYPNDPGCMSPLDPSELGTSQCDDSVDNDGDGSTDFPDDLGCTDPSDNDERNPPPQVYGWTS